MSLREIFFAPHTYICILDVMEAEWEKKRQKLYEEYGRFITNFEGVCASIRRTITGLMFFDKTKEPWEQYKHDELTSMSILLEGLTAKPLMDKLYALYLLKRPSEIEIIGYLKKMKILFADNLVPIRNSLSHGVVSHGHRAWGEKETNFDLFMLSHAKLGNQGFLPNSNLLSIETLVILNENVERLLFCLQMVSLMESTSNSSLVTQADFTTIIAKNLSEIKFKLELIENEMSDYFYKDV